MRSLGIERVFKVLALTMVLVAGVGGMGCNLLKKVAKSQKYGAIAYDEKTGGWGYSYDQVTEDMAKKAATKKCSTCTVKLTWQKGCGALAKSNTKPDVMAVGTGFNRPAAENAARADCVSKGGETCKIAVWACNSSK